MRVPVGWLAEYVDVPAGVGVEDLDTAFVRLGLEVEEVHRPAASRSGVIRRFPAPSRLTLAVLLVYVWISPVPHCGGPPG